MHTRPAPPSWVRAGRTTCETSHLAADADAGAPGRAERPCAPGRSWCWGDHAQPTAAVDRDEGHPARHVQPAAVNREQGHPAGDHAQPTLAANREEGRLPGHAQHTACDQVARPPPISELAHRTMDGVGGLCPPTDLDRSIRRWIDRCDSKFLNHISRNAARDEGSADGQSWMPTRIKNSQGITTLIV